MALSLNIANAFGTLPYSVVEEALHYNGMPLCLRRLVGHYLTDRVLLFNSRDGHRFSRNTACRVPQGSVLGPLLWNLGYDRALDGDRPGGQLLGSSAMGLCGGGHDSLPSAQDSTDENRSHSL